jgi:hypothetical protein
MIRKLSEVYEHEDDVIVAIERWVKNEAEVGRMARSDAGRLAEAGRILKRRFDNAWLGRSNKQGSPK